MLTRSLFATLIVVVLLACGGVLGTPLEQTERAYGWRVEELVDLSTRAADDPALIEQIAQEQAEFAEAYDGLPTDEDARAEELGKLNQRMRDAINAHEERVAALDAAAAAAAAAEGEQIRPLLTGSWRAPGYVLDIDAGGTVHYENNSEGMNKTIDAPLQNVTGNGFEVGIFGVTTEFDFDVKPHQAQDGTWQMTLSGVPYTRQ